MAATSRFGGLDILVSNAGAAQTGAMLELDDRQLADAYDLNFFVPYRFARMIHIMKDLPRMSNVCELYGCRTNSC